MPASRQSSNISRLSTFSAMNRPRKLSRICSMLFEHVELDEIDHGQQRPIFLQAHKIVEREAVAELLEFADAGDQHRRHGHGLEDFIDHVTGRQQADEVAHQGRFVKIDEGELALQQPVRPETQRIAYDLDAGLKLARDVRRDRVQRLPEQEFIREQAMFGVDNRLPREKGFLTRPVLLRIFVGCSGSISVRLRFAAKRQRRHRASGNGRGRFRGRPERHPRNAKRARRRPANWKGSP